MTQTFQVGSVTIGDGRLTVIAGPDSVETSDMLVTIARACKEACDSLGLQFILKASFDKANRTQGSAWRGIGLPAARTCFDKVRRLVGCPIVTDVHEQWHASHMMGTVDMLQVPALLIRQTDLVRAAAAQQLPVLLKVGQWMAPEDMGGALAKAGDAPGALLCYRGTTFGYHDVVADLRQLHWLKLHDCPVAFDASHTSQRPGSHGTHSGGCRETVGVLAMAAIAVGIDAIFIEVHPDPDHAPVDGPIAWPLAEVPALLASLKSIHLARGGKA